MTALLWLTRDLRVHDHPALRAALERCERIVPVFCFDDRLLGGRHASGPRTRFLLECLADLDERLGGLLVRHGAPERELPRVADEVGAVELHHSDDCGPFARRRIERVRRALEIPVFGHPGLFAVDDLGAVRTRPASPTPCSPRFTARGCRSRAGRCSAGPAPCAPPRTAPAFPRPVRDRPLCAAGRRDRGARAARRVPARRRDGLRGRPARRRRHLAALAVPALRLRVGARDRGAPAGRRGRGRLPPPALLARLLRPRAAAPPPQRALGVPAALPRDRAGAAPRAVSRRGARGAPASRSSTPACASCSRRAGCTTAPGSSSARS